MSEGLRSSTSALRRWSAVLELQAYFDESGHGPMVSICGFVADEEQWADLKREFSDVLDAFGVEYLHMTELISPNASAYKHLSMERRTVLVDAVMAEVRKTIPIAVCVSLDSKAFESATTTRFLSQIGVAYTICAATAVMLVAHILRTDNVDWEVIWTFEHGHANQSQLAARLTVLHENAARWLKLKRFGFSPSSPNVIPEPPLQLADMLAFAYLQPDSAFGTYDKLRSYRSKGETLRTFELRMNPLLTHRVWHPVAEAEANARKVRKLSAKGQRLTKDLEIGQLTDEHALRRQVDKVNKIMALLGADERIKIIETAPVSE